MSPAIAVAPRPVPGLEAALQRAGLHVAAPEVADALIWTSPGEADQLAALLCPRHRWVGFVVAGVERWVEAGIVDQLRTWTCARGVYADGVAEHAAALILADARGLPGYARARTWERRDGRRLRGATVTVLGAGAIGARLAQLLAPTGARLTAITRRGLPVAGFQETRRSDDLPAAVEGAGCLVVAAALTPATYRLVDGAVLDALGPEGTVVNVSRGGLVDTDALVERLRDGRLRSALLDVTDPEPLPGDHPLWALDNVLITPHVANPHRGNPWDAHLPELVDHLVGNARALAAGRPLKGTIDVNAGY